jgi:hypothetical protein
MSEGGCGVMNRQEPNTFIVRLATQLFNASEFVTSVHQPSRCVKLCTCPFVHALPLSAVQC